MVLTTVSANYSKMEARRNELLKRLDEIEKEEWSDSLYAEQVKVASEANALLKNMQADERRA